MNCKVLSKRKYSASAVNIQIFPQKITAGNSESLSVVMVLSASPMKGSVVFSSMFHRVRRNRVALRHACAQRVREEFFLRHNTNGQIHRQ